MSQISDKADALHNLLNQIANAQAFIEENKVNLDVMYAQLKDLIEGKPPVDAQPMPTTQETPTWVDTTPSVGG